MQFSKDIRTQFMLIPSLACQAECRYCFGPHKGKTMTSDMLLHTLHYMAAIHAERGQGSTFRLTFHGGEPLLAGYRFFEQALETIHKLFNDIGYELAIQSNLWGLTEGLCELFARYRVSVGTSIDGPQDITAKQRGDGYFERTMAGVRLLRKFNVPIGCIATFTKQSLNRYPEVYHFFRTQRLGTALHACLPVLGGKPSGFELTPQEHTQLFSTVLEHYIDNRKDIRISTIDAMAQSLVTRKADICTFKECVGMFIAIDPHGYIYPCQRFCGNPDYALGHISNNPTFNELMKSDFAQQLLIREKRMREVCESCKHIAYCNGGCPYNYMAQASDDIRDPYCTSYKSFFDSVEAKLAEEIASKENLEAIAVNPEGDSLNYMLKKGRLIEIVRKGPHPSEMARNARRIVAAVELARNKSIGEAAKRLVEIGVSATLKSAEESLSILQNSLRPGYSHLNNLYVHVTFRCNLSCSHCYANASVADLSNDMSVSQILRLASKAEEVGFRQIVFTGGEPSVHSGFFSLCKCLQDMPRAERKVNFVLRTNLYGSFTDAELQLMLVAFDQVVVSVDGDEAYHNRRRGANTYASTVNNLKRLTSVQGANKINCQVSVAAVLPKKLINGEEGESVKQLARSVGIKRVRFRPLLPIGRAREMDEMLESEALGGYLSGQSFLANGFKPISTCGIGQNLYIEPSGNAFPCYAYHGQNSFIGNVLEQGLQEVLKGKGFANLQQVNVDSNTLCKTCEVKYLCGGACRAWGKGEVELNSPPSECKGLKERAYKLLRAAQEYLAET